MHSWRRPEALALCARAGTQDLDSSALSATKDDAWDRAASSNNTSFRRSPWPTTAAPFVSLRDHDHHDCARPCTTKTAAPPSLCRVFGFELRLFFQPPRRAASRAHRSSRSATRGQCPSSQPGEGYRDPATASARRRAEHSCLRRRRRRALHDRARGRSDDRDGADRSGVRRTAIDCAPTSRSGSPRSSPAPCRPRPPRAPRRRRSTPPRA